MINTDRAIMPEQAPEIRAHNFREVALGYTPEQAMEEAGAAAVAVHVYSAVVAIKVPDELYHLY